MKNLAKSLLPLGLVAFGFAAPQAQATDAFTFRNLGFSADGRYFAFVDSVLMDGSGFPAAYATIVDVPKNIVVKTESAVIESENATEAQALKQAVAKLDLRKYGIDGKRKGNSLWMRLPTDLGPRVMKPEFSTYYGVDGGASTVWPKIQLTVKEVKAPGSAEEDCYWEMDRKMLDVSVKFENYDGKENVTTLQKDSRLPQSRLCVYSYEPREIIENNGAIVAVIRMQSPGFEGPDYTHMVVTHGSALKSEQW